MNGDVTHHKPDARINPEGHEMQVFNFESPTPGESQDDVINPSPEKGNDNVTEASAQTPRSEAETAEQPQPITAQGNRTLENGWTNSGFAAENLHHQVMEAEPSNRTVSVSGLSNHSSAGSSTALLSNQTDVSSANPTPVSALSNQQSPAGNHAPSALPGNQGSNSNEDCASQNSLQQKRPLTPPDVEGAIQEEEMPSSASEENKELEEEVRTVTVTPCEMRCNALTLGVFVFSHPLS